MDTVEKLNLTLNNPRYTRTEMLRKVCQCTAELIPSANLISIWHFDNYKQAVVSLINYDVSEGSWQQGLELAKADYPEYFRNLFEKDVIVASDARSHPATRGFSEQYFKPNDIYSLLDFILHKDFTPSGVICCESKGARVEWSPQDIDHIRMVATMISFFFDV